MENIMMRPTSGQMVKSESLGITGVVQEILTYQDVYDGMPESSLSVENARLMGELGSDYKERFFEVIVDVIESTEESEYKAGEQAMLSWDEFQSVSVLPSDLTK